MVNEEKKKQAINDKARKDFIKFVALMIQKYGKQIKAVEFRNVNEQNSGNRFIVDNNIGEYIE